MTKPGFRSDLADERDERIAHLRIPPHSVAAEQAVVGGLMLAPYAWDEVVDRVAAEDFYRRDHRLIFEAIAGLRAKGKPFDVVTLGEWFERGGTAEQIGGGAYLIELASTTPSAANITAYADIVREKAMLRRLIETGTRQIDRAFSGQEEPLTIAAESTTDLSRLLDAVPCDLEPIVPVMRRVFEELQVRYDAGGAIHGLPTGLPDLDELLCGLCPGLIILAGRPSMGKTSLAVNLAEHAAIVLGKAVAILSLEMGKEELGQRMLSSLGDVDSARVRSGQLDDVDWSNVNHAIRKISASDLTVSKPQAARVEHLVAQIRRQHARNPLALVVIDYLQLIEIQGDNTAQAYARVTRALKLLATELGIPLVLLSQLNRNLENRTNKRPVMADLRDSGAIEQDADVVLFVYRDEVYDSKSRDKGTAELIVAKQRNGRTDTVRVAYRGDRYRFSPLPAGWEPEAPPPKIDGEASRSKGNRYTRKPKSGRDAAQGNDP